MGPSASFSRKSQRAAWLDRDVQTVEVPVLKPAEESVSAQTSVIFVWRTRWKALCYSQKSKQRLATLNVWKVQEEGVDTGATWVVILLQRKPVELNSVQNPLAGGGHLEGSIVRRKEFVSTADQSLACSGCLPLFLDFPGISTVLKIMVKILFDPCWFTTCNSWQAFSSFISWCST